MLRAAHSRGADRVNLDPPCIGSTLSFARDRSSADPASPLVFSLETVKSGAPHRGWRHLRVFGAMSFQA
jgi:hypothetical protein